MSVEVEGTHPHPCPRQRSSASPAAWDKLSGCTLVSRHHKVHPEVGANSSANAGKRLGHQTRAAAYSRCCFSLENRARWTQGRSLALQSVPQPPRCAATAAELCCAPRRPQQPQPHSSCADPDPQRHNSHLPDCRLLPVFSGAQQADGSPAAEGTRMSFPRRRLTRAAPQPEAKAPGCRGLPRCVPVGAGQPAGRPAGTMTGGLTAGKLRPYAPRRHGLLLLPAGAAAFVSGQTGHFQAFSPAPGFIEPEAAPAGPPHPRQHPYNTARGGGGASYVPGSRGGLVRSLLG